MTQGGATSARRRDRGATRTVVCALVCSLMLGTTASGAVAADGSSSQKVGKFETGYGTDLALENPKCDPATARFRFEFFAAPPCVKEWTHGSDNGGKTAQGVTADSIEVVILYAELQQPQITGETGVYTNQATGKNEVNAAHAALLDENEVFEHVYETWGRSVHYTFVRATGSDEAAQRADAVSVKGMKPFAVIDLASAIGTPAIGGGKVFQQALVDAGVPYVSPRPTEQLTSSKVYGRLTAEFVKKQLAGGKAEHAGDSLKSMPRKYGVLHSTNFDVDYMNAQFQKLKLPVPVDAEFQVPATQSDVRTDAALVAESLPTLIARLKDAGVTTVLMEANHSVTGAATKEMAKQEWFPEVVIVSYPYQDLDLFARQYDQEVMSHAFGMTWFPPYLAGAGGDPSIAPFQWFWGTDRGTRWTIAFVQMLGLYSVIQFTGPKLTAKAVTPGVLSRIFSRGVAAGGYYSDSATTVEVRVSPPGQPAPRGVAMVWYDPNASGPGNWGLGGDAKGKYVYLNDGKRFITGKLPTKKQPFFDSSKSIATFDAAPPGEPVFPVYPCEGCPSTGNTAIAPAG